MQSGENTTGTTVAVFSRDSTTGTLIQLPGKEGCFSGDSTDPACTAVPVLGGPFAVTTSPDGSHVYVTDYTINAVTVFSADTSGALTPLPGLSQCVSSDGSGGACAPGIDLALPHETVLSPDGSFAYVAGHQDSAIDIFATEPSATAPPKNSTLPEIAGSTEAGRRLSANAGIWSGTQSGYAYRWEHCDSSGASCAPIAGAGSFTLAGAAAAAHYTPTPSDVGHTIRVVVTATNSAGSATATSAPSATIRSLPPSNTASRWLICIAKPPVSSASRNRALHLDGRWTCKLRSLPRPFKPAAGAAVARVTVKRHGIRYATGVSESLPDGRSELALMLLRPLTDGRYTLILRSRQGEELLMSRAWIMIECGRLTGRPLGPVQLVIAAGVTPASSSRIRVKTSANACLVNGLNRAEARKSRAASR